MKLLASALLILATACGGKAAGPAAIGNADPSGVTPSAGTASVDTARFVAMLDDDGAWATVIDPARGVADMHYVASPKDDAETQKWVKKTCGDDARALAVATAHAIKARIGTEAEYAPECAPTETGDGVVCFQGGIAEYDLMYDVRFEKTAAGTFILTGIATTDVGTTTDALDPEFDRLRAEPGC